MSAASSVLDERDTAAPIRQSMDVIIDELVCGYKTGRFCAIHSMAAPRMVHRSTPITNSLSAGRRIAMCDLFNQHEGVVEEAQNAVYHSFPARAA